MDKMEIFKLLTEIVLIILVLFLIFGKSFFSEKGKNLATKKDIKEITEKIESVKLEFNRKQSIDKYELELNQRLYNALNDFYNTLMDINRLSSIGQNVDAKWKEFEINERDLEKLIRNHNTTYFEKYRDLGTDFELHINNFNQAKTVKNQTEALKHGTLLLRTIEKFKLEIYNHINLDSKK